MKQFLFLIEGKIFCREITNLINSLFSYVQHRIEEQGDLLCEKLIKQNGWFYVAGNSKNMPTAVKEALTHALKDSKFVDELITAGRYQEETWS